MCSITAGCAAIMTTIREFFIDINQSLFPFTFILCTHGAIQIIYIYRVAMNRQLLNGGLGSPMPHIYGLVWGQYRHRDCIISIV